MSRAFFGQGPCGTRFGRPTNRNRTMQKTQHALRIEMPVTTHRRLNGPSQSFQHAGRLLTVVAASVAAPYLLVHFILDGMYRTVGHGDIRTARMGASVGRMMDAGVDVVVL